MDARLLEIKILLEKNNCILISDVYSHNDIKFLCPIHGEKRKSPNSIKHDQICIECNKVKRIESQKYTLDRLKYMVEVKNAYLNLKVIDDEYLGQPAPFRVECLTCKYQYMYMFINLHVKDRRIKCPKCTHRGRGLKRRKTFIQAKNEIAEYNLKLLNLTHPNGKILYEVQCTESHVFTTNKQQLNKGLKCPKCITNYTLSESICRRYFEYLFESPFKKIKPKWLLNKEGNRMELDGYNESLKLGFEYDGQQHFKFIKRFHKTRDDFLKRQEDDLLKNQLCALNHVTLIRIPYTIQNKDIFNFIKNQCHCNGFEFITKSDISLKELNFYNTDIQERSKLIDIKLQNSIWIRITNAITSHDDVTIQCNICNGNRVIRYYPLITKELPKCRFCFCNEKTIQIKNIVKDNWIVLSNFNIGTKPISMQCIKCKYLYTCTPDSIFGGHYQKNCRFCVCYEKTIEIRNIVKDNWILLSNFNKNDEHIFLQCVKCKCDYSCTPHSISKGCYQKKCNKCANI